MKNLIWTMLCLMSFSVMAQKVKLRDENFNCQEIRLPDKVLDASLKTYKAEIVANSPAIWDAGLSRVDIEKDYLKLDGFQRVNENPDFIIQMTIGDLDIIKEEVKETLKSVKGGDKPDNKQYHYVFHYTLPLDLALQPMGEKVYLNPVRKNQIKNIAGKTFTSPKFDTRTDAYKNRGKYLYQWKKEQLRKHVLALSEALSMQLNDRYGYPSRPYRYELKYAKVKKAPEFEPFKEEVMAMKSLLSSLKAHDNISEEVRTQVKEQAKAWGAAGEPLDNEDKHQGRLKGAYWHNAMVISLIIGDFETAKMYAGKLQEIEQEEREAKRALKRIAKLEEKLPSCRVDSRHFEFGIEDETVKDEMAAKKAAYYQDKAAEERRIALGLHDQAREFPTKIVYNDGTEFNGLIVVDYRKYRDFSFFLGGNVRAYSDDNGVIKPHRLVYSRMKTLDIGDRKFEIYDDRGLIQGGGEAAFKVLEVIKKTDKMNLFYSHPRTRDEAETGSIKPPYYVQKAGEDDMENLSNLKYTLSFRKNFAKYIEDDCPKLAQTIRDSSYKVKKKDLLEIVDLYNNSCE
ncbi:MAG: hypothetical protein MRY78_07395 [Saprospiraceae bacterium]|nr:hypothetical protein [Saprospiraceae bacterium]